MISHQQEKIIKDITKKYNPVMVGVFGSYARDEQNPQSDLDILVDPTPETTLMDLGAIRYELKKILGVPVDILTPKALPDNFRKQIIAEAKPIELKKKAAIKDNKENKKSTKKT